MPFSDPPFHLLRNIAMKALRLTFAAPLTQICLLLCGCGGGGGSVAQVTGTPYSLHYIDTLEVNNGYNTTTQTPPDGWQMAVLYEGQSAPSQVAHNLDPTSGEARVLVGWSGEAPIVFRGFAKAPGMDRNGELIILQDPDDVELLVLDIATLWKNPAILQDKPLSSDLVKVLPDLLRRPVYSRQSGLTPDADAGPSLGEPSPDLAPLLRDIAEGKVKIYTPNGLGGTLALPDEREKIGDLADALERKGLSL